MFGLLRDQSRSAAGAIGYVTIGTLMVIWAGLWYYYFLLPDPNPTPWQRFTCVGMILSGVAIGLIGLLFGLIGRGAKDADTTVGLAAAEPVVPTASKPPASVGIPIASAVPTASTEATKVPAVTAVPVDAARR